MPHKVLGPHVWQHGAKKSTEKAHLDITHFKSLSSQEVLAIQTEANRIVMRCRDITKGFMPKDVAEKKYGFHLYQGGVVPGNTLRVVNIADTDTEACCGTHADNTAEVGSIKILKTSRISDGILRLYFVAGERALQKQNESTSILNELVSEWGVTESEVVSTAARFFEGYKRFGSKADKQAVKILNLEMKVHLLDTSNDLLVFRSDESNPRLFISNMPQYAKEFKEKKKGAVFVGETWLYGLLGDATKFDAKKQLQPIFDKMQQSREAKEKKADTPQNDKKKKNKPITLVVKNSIGKKKSMVKGVSAFQCFSHTNQKALVDAFTAAGFKLKE
jgi:alanyl-tRNA synthetase